jgi:chaperonin cofactor prefoldin
MPILETLDQEHTDLALHVDLCAQRYEAMEKRLTSLEDKMDQLSKKIDSYKGDIVKILVGSCGTVIVAILGLIGVILTKF